MTLSLAPTATVFSTRTGALWVHRFQCFTTFSDLRLSEVDFNAKVWGCQFCFHRNKLPAYYDGMCCTEYCHLWLSVTDDPEGITPTNLPAELHPQATTIEYALSSGASSPAPAFVFVVDISVSDDDLRALKTSLLEIIGYVPENSYVGLITFGSSVNVYELAFQVRLPF